MQQFKLLDFIWLYNIHEKCRITAVNNLLHGKEVFWRIY
jgi:hypothetical protein